MDESESKNEKPKEGRRFSQEQYDMLKRCSEKRDEGIKEWNRWRKQYPNQQILLEQADLRRFYLREVDLRGAYLLGAHLDSAYLSGANLEGAVLLRAHFRNAMMFRTNFKMAKLGLDMEFAELTSSKALKGFHVYIKNVSGYESGADLSGATLTYASLEGCNLCGSNIRGADFRRATVDGLTLLWKCEVNRHRQKADSTKRGTDFREVGLDSVRIDPGTKQLLEYNIRRKNWEEWYKEHPRLKWLVELFWWISDYGLSTKRIIFTFFGLAIIFANIYYHWGRIAPPGIVGNLFIDRTSVVIPWQLVPLRTLYFSIVTMTTLGFGDMYAYPTSWFGHILLMVQVILGYVLLGALITRFAVLFTAGGPAGKFVDE